MIRFIIIKIVIMFRYLTQYSIKMRKLIVEKFEWKYLKQVLRLIASCKQPIYPTIFLLKVNDFFQSIVRNMCLMSE